jgi:peptidoglycan hydrolase CwlO-like protein
MELTIAMGISILSAVISVCSFAFNRKDKSNADVKDDSYKWGAIEQRLINIEKSLEKIDVKLDSFDKEVEEKIQEAIRHHEKEMHSEK